MAEMQVQNVFESKFKSVQLLTHTSLGIGSYGKVCKAKCDDLLCAAKILHPTLYSPINEQETVLAGLNLRRDQKEHRFPFQRFEQECQLMSGIRHPNIVQYLGIYHEPSSSSNYILPILLMELMDQNLTQFLERADTKAIPYHVQINLCHDIALALSFLHSNGIIHRDLSSNNVLLTLGGQVRAKLSDFGMARLDEISSQLSKRRGTFTKCPGTDVYMPPEAVQTYPVYSEKIDCFSFGVLIVQILTRLFPRPSERHKMVEVDDPRFPSGTIRACVSEVERRQTHISKIDIEHPLFPIVLQCLRNSDIGRPTAHELCERLETLKSTPKYKDDKKLSNGCIIPKCTSTNGSVANQEDENVHICMTKESSLEVKDRQIFDLRSQLQHTLYLYEQSLRKIEMMENELANARKRLKESEQLEVQLQLDQKSNDQFLDVHREQAQISISRSVERDMNQIQQEAHKVRGLKKLVQSQAEGLKEKELLLDQKEKSISELESGIAIKEQTIRQTNALNEKIVHSMEQEIQKLKRQICDKAQGQDQLEREEVAASPLLSYVYVNQQQPASMTEQMSLYFYSRIRELEEQLRSRSEDQPPSSLQQLEGSCKMEQSPSVLLPSSPQIQWREGRRAPREMCRWSDAISTGDKVYFRLLNTHKVFVYAIACKEWTRLPDCVYHSCPLAIINGLLTTIGGYYHSYFNQLVSFVGAASEKRWTEILPPMPTKRSRSTALNTGSTLIVAGGEGKEGKLVTVEMMNTETLQWSSTCPLLEPLYNASAAICDDTVYMMGGYNKEDLPTKSVYACSLSNLIQSHHRVSIGKRIKRAFSAPETSKSVNLWRKISDLPVSESTCVAVQNHLIAVGGKDSDEKPSPAVHMYDSTSESWVVISHMIHPIGRYQCFVVGLPHNQLMVVGGWTANERASTSVEMGTVHFDQ